MADDPMARLSRPASCCAPRAIRHAGHGRGGGQPFASLVTPACAPDLSLLLLLSDLSEHTGTCAPNRAARSW